MKPLLRRLFTLSTLYRVSTGAESVRAEQVLTMVRDSVFLPIDMEVWFPLLRTLKDKGDV